jgi:hypothetical protein
VRRTGADEARLPSTKTSLFLSLLAALSAAVLAGCGGTVADNGGPTGTTSGTNSTTSGTTGVTDETTAASTTMEATTTPASGVLFPQQKPSDGLPMSARIRGELVLDEAGCLRIDSGGPPDFPKRLPLWPDYFELSARGDEIRVLDGEGDFVARVGGRIKTGGGTMQHGETTPRETFWFLRRGVGLDMARELQERCSGPYWIVGASEDHMQYP